MEKRVRVYLSGTVICAIACAVSLYYHSPEIPTGSAGAVLLLCALALVAEALGVWHANSVVGSVGFIPFLALVLVVPNWIALVGAVLVRATIELMSKRAAHKSIFNISLQTITFGVAVLVYSLAGGESMRLSAQLPLAGITIENGFPAIVAFFASFAVNSTLVAGIIAAGSNRRFVDVWRGTHKSTIALDIFASPVVFMFAWVYVTYGAYAATVLWLPVLGLRQLHKNNLDLERTNSELLELMVKSMEARDPYTSGHSRRVQEFSVAIARGLGLSAAELDRVSRAALLHDVGKIHEKYAPILRKPGNLTPDEWQTMQRHPADGAELVSTMSRLHDIVPGIRHHHERWDGTGYPEGLAGETIPRISRIIAFADTIDAMTSERPYRQPLSEAEVRSELVRCRGTQFDPAITDQILSAPVWRQLFPPTVVEVGRTPSVLSLQRAKSKVASQS